VRNSRLSSPATACCHRDAACHSYFGHPFQGSIDVLPVRMSIPGRHPSHIRPLLLDFGKIMRNLVRESEAERGRGTSQGRSLIAAMSNTLLSKISGYAQMGRGIYVPVWASIPTDVHPWKTPITYSSTAHCFRTSGTSIRASLSPKQMTYSQTPAYPPPLYPISVTSLPTFLR
jgi:hypothetical protein